MCVYIYIYILEVGGVSLLLTPTGKSVRFVHACERARRGEAAWASERRFDREARAVLGEFCCCCSCSVQIVPVVRGLSGDNF